MCNVYSMTTNQAAIIAIARALRDHTGNLAPLPGIFPDYKAPVVRNAPDGIRELAMLRWGMPSSQKALLDATSKRANKLRAKGKEVNFDEPLKMEPDIGTTNIRNTNSKHWKPWLGVEHRCVVPFTSFSEFNKDRGGASVRKVREGLTTNDLFAFLTTEPNAEVGQVHPKAMPVILRTPDQIETWMTAPAEEALKLQAPLPDGLLKIVATGVKEDVAA
jgi:putative SOS response-associated peptidase YedK